ncbi:MAG: biopolymer transporter Tol [Planctomycetes bacterium]|nr:biopolymer transporter Tol [Planctomycetota bacterium]
MRHHRFLGVLYLFAILAASAPAQPGGHPAPEKPKLLLPSEAYLSNAKQITFEGQRSGEAYFHPDGKKICFQSVRGKCPHYQIYVKQLDGTRLVRVSPGDGLTTCSFFHPSQPLMIWASTHLDPASYRPPPMDRSKRYKWEKHASFDIFVSDHEGGNRKRLTHTKGYDAECAFSPDGTRICFTSQRDGDLEIYTMAADGSDVRRVTNAKGYDGGPFYSPDGKQICFRGFRDPKNPRHAQIYVINADGTNERKLTDTPAANWCPFFDPTGKYLVYSRNVGDHRNFELFIVPTAGGKSVRITTDPGADVLPAFSPDGKQLMWTSTRVGGKSQVFIADIDMPKADMFAGN